MFLRIGVTLGVLLVAAPTLFSPPLRGQPSGYEYFDPAPVDSTFIAPFTEDDLDLYDYANLRLIEFDVIDAEEGQFMGAFIVNEGKYHRQWHFRADKSRSNMLFESQDPINMYLDIERTYFHESLEEWHYAVLYVDNPESRPWVVLADVDFTVVNSQLRNRRPLDFDERLVGETVKGPGPIPGIRYDTVLVANVGENYMDYMLLWMKWGELNKLGQGKEGWVPVDIQPSVAEPGLSLSVLVRVPEVKPYWWYGVEMPAASVQSWIAGKGRITNIQPCWTKPGTYNATFLLDK